MKNSFSRLPHGGYLGFFSSGEEVKNSFSRLPHGGYLGFPMGQFYSFFFYLHPDASHQVESIGLTFQEKKRKIDFQDGHHCHHLGFPIGTILAIFDLQVSQMLFLPSFESWPFSSGDEGKIRFSKWLPSWISDWNDLGYFFIYKSPRYFQTS